MEQIKVNLEIQLSELETLQSTFYNPGEVRVEDSTVLGQIHAFLQNTSKELPPYLDITVNLVIDEEKFEICANLSHEYPDIEPDIFVRNHKLNRTSHAQLNKSLSEFVSSLNRSEPCVFSAISWLQDNAKDFIVPEEIEEQKIEKNETLIRYWIYSHHIYSKTKRKEILDSAEKLCISGFCMPGKPGVICIEGATSDCVDWWQTIKSMNWKKIFVKVTEEENVCRKFKDFNEVVFPNNSIKNNHMDMGELSKFLEDHNCGYVFKQIFGVEARSSTL